METGSMIKAHLRDGQTVEGTLFAVDTIGRTLVIKCGAGFKVLFAHAIVGVEGKLSPVAAAEFSRLGADERNLERKEQIALDRAKKSVDSLNTNVSQEVQTLFDRLQFTYPCQWTTNNGIIVLDNYIIDPPYDQVVPIVARPAGAGPDLSLQHMIKVLEGERRKLNL